ncbi:MAG: outer membrane beta-barrel domain-containing protein [Archangium sp.]|nr:outer membrane beta-barrel domain-containing protein [Archangium sp.]
MRTTRTLMACLVVAAGAAWAEGAPDEVVEKVAVRNRLFSVGGRFEVGANVGFSLLTRLTEHYHFNAAVAFNAKDWLAFEVRGGYAYSQLTSLGEQVQSDFFKNMSIGTASDASDAWRMNAHGVLGVRLQPIYGKFNLVAELPVHFQMYVWLGGGVSGFERESLVMCPNTAACSAYVAARAGPTPFVVDRRVGPVASVALGLRAFLTSGHAVRIEARDWSYVDSFFIGIDRATSSASNPTSGGRASPTAGITNVVQLDLGYSFIF